MFFAILIALSLAVAPVGSAMAAMHPGVMGATDAVASLAEAMPAAMAGMGVSDCAKMGMTSAHKSSSDCPCCGDTKSKCPGDAACLMKCGAHVLAILTPADVTRLLVMIHSQSANPEAPPDWASAPPQPPPRA